MFEPIQKVDVKAIRLPRFNYQNLNQHRSKIREINVEAHQIRPEELPASETVEIADRFRGTEGRSMFGYEFKDLNRSPAFHGKTILEIQA